MAAGETVLDLGSGAGNDAFIARHEVGSDGRVIGVDMTPEMIDQGSDQRLQARLRQCRVPARRDRADARRDRQRRRRDLQLRPEPRARQGRAPLPRCSACCDPEAGSASPTSWRPGSCRRRCRTPQDSMSAVLPERCPRPTTSPCSVRSASSVFASPRRSRSRCPTTPSLRTWTRRRSRPFAPRASSSRASR